MLNNYLTKLLSTVREDEEGQTMVEYSLILALVSIAAIVILGALGVTVDGVFTTVDTALGGV